MSSTLPQNVRYAPSVRIYGNGVFVYRVHSEQAAELVERRVAKFTEADRHKKRIWRIHLVATTAKVGQRVGDPHFGARNFATAAPVFLEVLGYTDRRLATYSFKPAQGNRSDKRRMAEERRELKGTRVMARAALPSKNAAAAGRLCKSCRGTGSLKPDGVEITCWGCSGTRYER